MKPSKELEKLAASELNKGARENWRYFSPDHVEEHVRSIHPRSEDFEDGDLVDRVHSAHKYEHHENYPIDGLDENEFYTDEGHVANLASKKQFNTPIVVHKYSDGTHSIVDGSHRVAAAKRAGLKTLPTYVGLRKDQLNKGEGPHFRTQKKCLHDLLMGASDRVTKGKK